MTQKISDVLKKASKSRKQIVGEYTKFDKGKIVGYCALGAIGCELGKIDSSMDKKLIEGLSVYDILDNEFPSNMVRIQIYCPKCKHNGENCYMSSTGHYIVHLNDNHGMTFREIVDELRRIGC